MFACRERLDELGRLAGFRVLRPLGAGGMGLVFEAEDLALRRRIALKVMKPAFAAVPKHRQRFLREARAAAALRHDHIIEIYQVGEDNGVAFLAMPLLAGGSLADCLSRQPVLALPDVLRIGREIAAGLAAAHAAGVIHRDIKPDNIWLEALADCRMPESASRNPQLASGRVKLLDFGLARVLEDDDGLSMLGAVVGTPGRCRASSPTPCRTAWKKTTTTWWSWKTCSTPRNSTSAGGRRCARASCFDFRRSTPWWIS